MEIFTELQMLGRLLLPHSWAGVCRTTVGMRTHMLVGVTATLFIILADVMFSTFDPRAIEAIVVGISSLGAGTILKYRQEGERVVKDLTTSCCSERIKKMGTSIINWAPKSTAASEALLFKRN